MPRSRGTVRWFDEEEGYGFIRPYNGNADLLVRRSGIVDGGTSLTEGDEVAYEPALNKDSAALAGSVCVLASLHGTTW